MTNPDRKFMKRFLAVSLVLILVLILTSGCVSVDAGDPVYRNGNLTTVIAYSGETQDVWVQNTVARTDGLRSVETGTVVLPYTFRAGQQVCELPFNLTPGTYQVTIYVLGREDSSDRIAAFIRNFEVV
jgi:uncharacterized protein YceK